MFKAVSTIVTLTTVAVAQYNDYGSNQYGGGYGAQAGYQAQAGGYHAQGGYHAGGGYAQPAQQYSSYGAPQHGQYGPQYGSYGYGYEPHKFHKPGPLIDPKYYKNILSNFKQCRTHKCDALGRGYSKDIKESIQVLGEYTSCVTACAADEAFRSVQDARSALAKVYDIGFAQLTLARKYLGGQGDYDVIGNCTRIDDSCCLPEDYFTSWERIMIPVQMTGVDDVHQIRTVDNTGTEVTAASFLRMVSVTSYLKKCTVDDDGLEVEWLDNIRFDCDTSVVEYLELMQRNVGHLILAPKCLNLAPDGACNEDKPANPRSEEFPDDVCVAKYCAINGKTQSIEVPIIKEVNPTRYWKDSCPDDETVFTGTTEQVQEIVIQYERVPRAHLKYYTVTTGLPSLTTTTHQDILDAVASGDIDALASCEYTQGVANVTDDFFEATTFGADAIAAAKLCPYTGLHEYCNMDQYASYLQKQLFDNDLCQVVDMKGVHGDQPQYFGTLACLFKIVTLKCDCMQAVLNCYEHEYHFSKALAQTIGKAASILCGFILCQRPSVYSLFGGQGAIEKARIMRELMSQVGLTVPTMASMPPATFAFLSFGLGMVAFVTTKYIAKKARKPVNIDDGYRNLI